jgi:hypothetical protein
MSAETAGSTGTDASRPDRAWGPWLRIAAIAAALLVISEAIWVWQTWPVRELLQGSQPLPARNADVR